MNKVAAFALRRKNCILSMSEKMFCPPQPLRFWITPACAGKRDNTGHIRHPIRDHPRVCGEKWVPLVFSFSVQGSPPRMRGKAEQIHPEAGRKRITPAHAGKSWCADPSRSAGRDHPRVCGEKRKTLAPASSGKGSPPRVRGKVTGISTPVAT